MNAKTLFFFCASFCLTKDVCFAVADSNAESNYNKSVTLPEDAALGESTFSASLTSLYGVQYTPSLAFFNVTFTVGDETSEDYVYGNAS